jgi:hypothetical protein
VTSSSRCIPSHTGTRCCGQAQGDGSVAAAGDPPGCAYHRTRRSGSHGHGSTPSRR